MRSYIFSTVLVLLFLNILVETTNAVGTLSVKRGQEPVTLNWAVLGAPSCEGTFSPSIEYPSASDNLRTNWRKTHLGSGGVIDSQATGKKATGLPGTYDFKCEYGAVSDTATLIVLDCSNNEAWNAGTEVCQICANGGCTAGANPWNPSDPFKICNNKATNAPTCTVCNNPAYADWNGTTNACVPKPSVLTFTVNPNTPIAYNSSAMLSWTSTGATSCSIDQGIGPVSSNGTVSTGNRTVSTTFTLTCTNGISSVSQVGVTNVSGGIVVVSPPPAAVINTFTSTPANPIPSNTPATLTWTTTGSVGGCTLNGSPVGSNSFFVTPSLTLNTSYTLICTNGITPVSQVVTVKPISCAPQASLYCTLPPTADGDLGTSACVADASKNCHYKCVANVWQPDTNFTPNTCPVPGPNLVNSGGITVSSGPYTQGSPINITAIAKNIGNLTTGLGFSDTIDYSWTSNTGPWTQPANFPHGPLAINGEVNDTTNFTPLQGGTLWIRHRVDYLNNISNESDETDNSYVINSGISGLTVAGIPDLVSQNFNVSAPSGWKKNKVITFDADVKNIGSINAGAFSDNFSYQWGGSINPFGWIDLPLISHGSGLVVNTSAHDTQNFTLNNTGTLFMQHCVDSLNQIAEVSGEVPNCTVFPSVTVPQPVGNSDTCAGGLIPSTWCTLPPQPVDEGSTAGGTCSPGGQVCTYKCGNGGVYTPIAACPIPPQYTTYKACNGATCATAGGSLSVNAGTPITYTWDVSNADSCEKSFVGGNTINGTANLSEPSAPGNSYQATLRCKLGSGNYDIPKVITINSLTITPKLVAIKRTVPKNGTTDLVWDIFANPLGSCSLTGGGLSLPNNVSFGSIQTGPITGRTVFTITCPGNAKAVQTVEVVPERWDT